MPYPNLEVSCNQCDYNVTTKGSLLTHIKSIHEGVKFPCDQCDYKATIRGHLLRHMKSIHEGIKFSVPNFRFGG